MQHVVGPALLAARAPVVDLASVEQRDIATRELALGAPAPAQLAPAVDDGNAHGVVEVARIAVLHGMAAENLHAAQRARSEEHTSELQSHSDLVCRLLLGRTRTPGRLGHARR